MTKQKTGLKRKVFIIVLTVIYICWVVALAIVRFPVSTDTLVIKCTSDNIVYQQDLQLVYDNGDGFIMPYVDKKGELKSGTLINAQINEEGTLNVTDDTCAFDFSVNQTNAKNIQLHIMSSKGEAKLYGISFMYEGKEVLSYTPKQIYEYFEPNGDVSDFELKDDCVVIKSSGDDPYITGNDDFVKKLNGDLHRMYAENIIMILILTAAYIGIVFGKRFFKKFI